MAAPMETIAIEFPLDPSKEDATTFVPLQRRYFQSKAGLQGFHQAVLGSNYVIPIGRHALFLFVVCENPDGFENNYASIDIFYPGSSGSGHTKQPTSYDLEKSARFRCRRKCPKSATLKYLSPSREIAAYTSKLIERFQRLNSRQLTPTLISSPA
jgi:hypothetical protein